MRVLRVQLPKRHCSVTSSEVQRTFSFAFIIMDDDVSVDLPSSVPADCGSQKRRSEAAEQAGSLRTTTVQTKLGLILDGLFTRAERGAKGTAETEYHSPKSKLCEGSVSIQLLAESIHPP
ncbi:hypothetical protein BLNAU_23432 [Blattamonas nauphoetae]|uniref:Uncharacterized protein n=1 Tax=Blattamonas nauphoetae TaxID=2049346 RepID=A0ABQ9WUF3_9EUKA|nr:hypothetical protein BLNAU_23432 [Blattamonas nauphoetae]